MPGRRVNIPTVHSFVFDDENQAKIEAHGLTTAEVDQVLGNIHVIFRNRRGRRSPILIVGLDDGGRCLAIPAEPTYHVTDWRPITAWPCKVHERNALRRRTRG